MKSTHLLYVTIAILFVGCNFSSQNKEIHFNNSEIAKDWTLRNVQPANELKLSVKNASIVSNFETKNFEFSAKIKTVSDAEGVLFFHTNENLSKGYKVIINNSDYSVGNPMKTGGLAFIRNNFVNTATNDNFFDLKISVVANHIKIEVNGYIITDYIEVENSQRAANVSNFLLSKGKIAITKTGETGEILIADMSLKTLKNNIPNEESPIKIDDISQTIDSLNQVGFPLIDFHGHLKGGLTMEQAREHARNNGFNYGIAANCGLKFPVTNDSSLIAYLDQIKDEPVLKAMQAEGREWVTLFSPEAVAKFDYIFTDAMTWTDNKGRRMRLWMPEETFVDNDQQFMDMLVNQIETEMATEPVDIYVNPTFLPKQLEAKYDSLWTDQRIERVVNALKNNNVALEINARYKIPSLKILQKAKEAGVKFTFGTNNTKNDDLFRLEYCIKVIQKLNLTANDIFLPRPKTERKVLKMGLIGNND